VEKVGVLLPSGGEEDVEEACAGWRESSGDKLFESIAGSDFELGISIGSDISSIVRV
jgi:hypothetical protein